jgi:hypothetical protein
LSRIETKSLFGDEGVAPAGCSSESIHAPMAPLNVFFAVITTIPLLEECRQAGNPYLRRRLVVMVMMWVSYSAQIFLLGAGFTWSRALTFGSRKEQKLPGAAPAVPSKTADKQPDPNMVEAKEAAVDCAAEDEAEREESS